MFTIRKKFKFEMAHQLHESYSCACHEQIHGHSYVLELFFENDTLNETGMVIDFGEVKDKIGDYVMSWDHSLVMPKTFADQYLKILATYNKNLKIVEYNPTAELMAKDMFEHIKGIVPSLSKVRLHETTTGYAEYYV